MNCFNDASWTFSFLKSMKEDLEGVRLLPPAEDFAEPIEPVIEIFEPFRGSVFVLLGVFRFEFSEFEEVVLVRRMRGGGWEI